MGIGLIQQRKYNYLVYFVALLLVKFVYIHLNILMLPEIWVNFYFDRNVCLPNIIYELIFFFVYIFVYLHYLRKNSPISFISTVLLCLYIIPSNSTMVLSDYDFTYFFSSNLYNLLLLIFLGKTACSLKNTNAKDGESFWKNEKLQKSIKYVTRITCLGIIFYVYFLQGTISISNIFESDIYEQRAVVADLYLQNTDGFIAYLMTIWKAFYNSMLIIGLYTSFRNGKIYDIALCIFTYLVLFSFESQKTLLFKPIIAIFIYFLARKSKLEKANSYFLFGYIFILCISYVEYYTNSNSIIYSVIIRRIAYMPQYLSHAYYEFFLANDKMWLTHDFFQLEKIVRIFYSGTYNHGIVAVISENCFPGVPSPNTGMFAEAFSQLGYLGILVFPYIVAKMFGILNKYATYYGEGTPHVLLASLLISIINIQILAPRGILIVLLFILITYIIKKSSFNTNISN